MTEVLPDSSSATTVGGDAELITAVRKGDIAAFGVLYERHHDAAVRLAHQLAPGPDADDLAADAFTKVLKALQNGKGPTESFRAYLLTAVRSVHVDRIRAHAKLTLTDDEDSLDRRVEFIDPAAMNFERGAAAEAFAALPERWQTVLWHLDVEGQKPADVAPLLDMSPNSVSALAYRAREGLRQAYLQSHLAVTADETCRWTTSKLGAHVRKGLSAREVGKVDAHLDDCLRCTGLYLELREINSDLGAVLAPVLLGSAAVGYLAGGSAAVGAVGFAGFAKVVGAGISKVTIEPAKSAASSMGPAGVAAAAAVTVAAAAAGVVASGGDSASPPPPPTVAASAPEASPEEAATPAEQTPEAIPPTAVREVAPTPSRTPIPQTRPANPATVSAVPPADPPKKPEVVEPCTDHGGVQIANGALIEVELPFTLLDLGWIAYVGDGEKC